MHGRNGQARRLLERQGVYAQRAQLKTIRGRVTIVCSDKISYDEKRGDQLLVKEIKLAPPLWKSCSHVLLTRQILGEIRARRGMAEV